MNALTARDTLAKAAFQIAPRGSDGWTFHLLDWAETHGCHLRYMVTATRATYSISVRRNGEELSMAITLNEDGNFSSGSTGGSVLEENWMERLWDRYADLLDDAAQREAFN